MSDRLSDTQLKDLIAVNVTEAETILAQLQTLISRHHKVQTELLARLAPLPPASLPQPVPEPESDPTLSPDLASDPQAGPTPPTDLNTAAQLVINIAGHESRMFQESQATDLGRFDHLGVSVSARVQRKDQYTVQFNRRAYADRQDLEVIVTYGYPTNDKTFAVPAPDYKITIIEGDLETTNEITGQSWMQDIRVYGKPIDLTLSLPDFFPNTLSASFHTQPYEPAFDRALGGLTPAMPTTGERREIGAVTRDLAAWSMTQDVGARATAIKQVQSMDAWPMHVQEAPGVPFKVMRGTSSWSATMHSNHTHRASYIARAPAPQIDGKELKLDSAHYPAVFWGYAMTGDPYYLRQLHYRLARASLSTDYYRQKYGIDVVIGQPRAFAWALRDIFLALMLTPEDTPDWLLPHDYIRGLLKDALAWVDHLQTLDAPWARLFRSCKSPSSRVFISFWMNDFIVAVLGLMVRAGFEECRPAFEWFLESIIQRTNGTSGWPRQNCAPYNLENIPGEPQSWAELSAAYAAVNTTHAELDLTKDEYQGNSLGYLSYARACLAIAEELGYPVSEARAWVETQFLTNPNGAGDTRYTKWAWA